MEKLSRNRVIAILVICSMILPYIFTHIWWLRLLSVLVFSLVVVYEIGKILVNPNLIFRDVNLINLKIKRMSIWFFRLLFLTVSLLIFYVGIFTTSKDIVRSVFNLGPHKEMIILENGRAGRFWFVGQSFDLKGRNVILPLYLTPLSNGKKYTVTFFPESYLVYDIVSVD